MDRAKGADPDGQAVRGIGEAGYGPIVLKMEARFHREAMIGEKLRDTPTQGVVP
jgi:acyl-CoA thioesterase FadM